MMEHKLTFEEGKLYCNGQVVGMCKGIELVYAGDEITSLQLRGPVFFSERKLKEAMRAKD